MGAPTDVSVPSVPSVARLRRRVLRLAGPICAALVGALAQLVVAALLGHMGDDALYVRALFIPVTFLVLAVQEGLDVSTQVGFARLRGARDGDDAPTSATTALLGRFVGAGTAVLGAVALLVVLAAPALATVLAVPGPLVAEFVAFARWTVVASVLSVPTTVAAAALRGWGRTGASATVALLVAGLQVVVVWLAGLVGGFGVLAVPVAITGRPSWARASRGSSSCARASSRAQDGRRAASRDRARRTTGASTCARSSSASACRSACPTSCSP